METRVSSKGQVVLPSPVRRKLGIQVGDPLDVRIDRGRVILSRKRGRPAPAVLARSPRTGLPVLKVAAGAAPVTSELVEQLLDELP
jgi:AbrB family looped-hinge helix DNA binding protein